MGYPFISAHTQSDEKFVFLRLNRLQVYTSVQFPGTLRHSWSLTVCLFFLINKGLLWKGMRCDFFFFLFIFFFFFKRQCLLFNRLLLLILAWSHETLCQVQEVEENTEQIIIQALCLP